MFSMKSLSEAVEDAAKSNAKTDEVRKKAKIKVGVSDLVEDIEEDSKSEFEEVQTDHKENCPECGGTVKVDSRRSKGLMTVYGLTGVRKIVHLESRCQEPKCRIGLYKGYRILKGGNKIYDGQLLGPIKDISCCE